MPIKPKVRQELDRIDKFLTTATTAEAMELWDILAALRGPDIETAWEPKRFTVKVRRKAFPLASKRRNLPASFSGTPKPGAMLGLLTGSRHFAAHIRDAYAALGLKRPNSNDF